MLLRDDRNGVALTEGGPFCSKGDTRGDGCRGQLKSLERKSGGTTCTFLAILLSRRERAASTACGVSRGCAASEFRKVLSCMLGRNGSTTQECATELSFCASFAFAAVAIWMNLKRRREFSVPGITRLEFQTPTLRSDLTPFDPECSIAQRR